MLAGWLLDLAGYAMFLLLTDLLRMAMFVSELLEVLSWNELELLMQNTRHRCHTTTLHLN